MKRVDIAVVGGGPAGATFARLAGEAYRVALLDRRRFHGDGEGPAKCCGGLLSPDGQRSLAAQGLNLPLHVLVDPQIFAVKTMDMATETVRYYPRPYVNMDREAFDQWLISLLPPRVEVLEGAVCRAIRRTGDGFAVTYRQNGEEHTLLADRIVGADGGNSLVRRTFFPHKPIRRYVAVQEWYEAGDQSPFYGALFDRELTDCYGWLISKNNSLVLGAALPEEEAARRFEKLKGKLEERGIPFGSRIKREGCMVCRPSGPSALCTGGKGVFLLGEAAGFISPSSLQGISYALDSGAMLAGALRQGTAGAEERYRRLTEGIRLRLLGKLGKNPVLYTPWIRRMILATGVGSLHRICEPMVEKPRRMQYTGEK